MTINEIVAEYGVSESTARRKMKGIEGKLKHTEEGKRYIDYRIGDVKAAFKAPKAKPGPKGKK